MTPHLTFDDILLLPKFSRISSRKDVSLDNGFSRLPIISANMDTITSVEMARTMKTAGGLACLHRFWSIEDNVAALVNSAIGGQSPWVAVGLGDHELKRAKALYDHGARMFVLDVAHAANINVVDMYMTLKDGLPDIFLTVGNFATFESVNEFWVQMNQGEKRYDLDGIKIGIGPGSACTTRIKTGVGVPQLSAIIDIASNMKDRVGLVIADGGCRTPGDVAKALAAGAHMVMLGGMLAGTDETPGEMIVERQYTGHSHEQANKSYKKYRGSASKESYEVQGKTGSHLTDEGESFTVLAKGTVANVLQDIEGGLRSAFSYTGSANLEEFHKNAEFIQITNSGLMENKAHGKI